MLDRPQSRAPTAFWIAEREAMAGGGNPGRGRARCFRDAALPHLDEVFTLARHLLRNAADAEDAPPQRYLRAPRHFDTYRGPAKKTWLSAILRMCAKSYSRGGTSCPPKISRLFCFRTEPTVASTFVEHAAPA
jgi:DNA-directed RNA polymerase specialized sigma24 family protein